MTDMFGPDDPGGGPPDYWQARWADTGEPGWWDDQVTIYGDWDGTSFASYTYTAEDWFNEVTTYSGPELIDMYGLDNIDIINQLMDQGLWERGYPGFPSEDWAYWRELYEEA